jgi:molybdenum cofactor synthesis domain-containing protein
MDKDGMGSWLRTHPSFDNRRLASSVSAGKEVAERDGGSMSGVSDEPVTAAVLVIGDEILSGRTQDTNTRDIARYLAVIGVDLAETRTVPDVLEEIVAALNALRERYDYVVTTGGIGPTHDDITADAVAAAFGVELEEHPEIIAMMTARWGGELTPARRRMARVPVGGDLVKNPVQGPPGFTIGNVFTLAGVPSIMRGMLEDVGPRMRGGRPTVSRTVRVEGSGEGVIAAPLEAVAKAHPDMSLGSYPFFGADGYGSNLVIRGRDPAVLGEVVIELITALKGAGIENVREVEAA